MRTSSRLASLALSVALVAVLSGCFPPTPTAAPVFASDQDALAAAEEAYAEYMRVTAAIFESGAADLSPIHEVAVGAQLHGDLAGFEEVAANHLQSVGDSLFGRFSLERYESASRDGAGAVVIRVCDNIAEVDVLDAQRKSVVSPTRPDETYFRIEFDIAPDDPQGLLVSNKTALSNEPCWFNRGISSRGVTSPR